MPHRFFRTPLVALGVFLTGAAGSTAEDRGAPWKRHTIDGSSRGADGVRLADVNGDGRLDIATGWEEGGRVRVYLNPGPEEAREPWPAVTVGEAPSVEDAVFLDLDRDGSTDVVSCSEGSARTMWVHWGPKDRAHYLHSEAWKTEAIPASRGMAQWMFCLPLQVDGRNGIDLLAGGKNQGAQIGWWEAPTDARRLADWKWHPLRSAGWIMTLAASDMDGDGDTDLLVSDRKGAGSGCFWLENPGTDSDPARSWPEHRIGGQGREVMFLALCDLDGDGQKDVIAAARPNELLYFRRLGRDGKQWETRVIPLPENTGSAKAVNAGDIDRDGQPDLVFTCEGATGGKSGVMWMTRRGDSWQGREISGPDGIKHDLVELLDLDGDGDLDALTCEETKNLGVVWYENPRR